MLPSFISNVTLAFTAWEDKSVLGVNANRQTGSEATGFLEKIQNNETQMKPLIFYV